MMQRDFMDKWKPLQKLGTFITKPWNPRKGDHYPNHSMSSPNPSHSWKQIKNTKKGNKKKIKHLAQNGSKND
jgi:hypothetical protein